MIEDRVFSHLSAILTREHAFPVQDCRVSVEMRPPWGRSYRLVEWTLYVDAPAWRRIVPAESTDMQIAQVVASHVPGRLYESGTAQRSSIVQPS